MYKACAVSCYDGDLLAAIDAAIDDGVDLLSISIGPESPFPFYYDVIALGAFRAIQKGIFVSCSAGNDGPYPSTVTNDAPWILTVGASTIDREIRATVKLGNNVELHGQSLFQPKDFHPRQPLPIVHPAAISNNESAAVCEKGSLKNIDVKGKIVICHMGQLRIEDKGKEVKDNGGAAMIVFNEQDDGYTTLGPSTQSRGILKPDIVGPGLNILSAWGVSIDEATNPFNVISGTSMSCPHLSGVAALIKSAHPDWSPAAIKSAILTTAYTADLNGNPISMFDRGSGHVHTLRALNPGLVYDIEPDDYIPYLCGLGYSEQQVRYIVQRKVNCSTPTLIPGAQLNYPTFSMVLGAGDQMTYTRTVTNVGRPFSTYISKVLSPQGVAVKVMPSVIRFKDLNDKASYTVTFTRLENVTRSSIIGQGSLVWNSIGDDGYKVVSTIAVVFV
ncbi:unnamed protein product [Linum tenue]|nr:unnamed protein product [Linum tenue]